MSQCMPCTTNCFLLDKIVLNQFSTVDTNGRLHLTTYFEIVVNKRDNALVMHNMETAWYKNNLTACM